MTEGERKVRILVAKCGLDGHDRGVRVIARAFQEAGFEVIYTGLHQTPEAVVEAALQEDVDAIGVSVLSAAHMTLFPRLLELLKKNGGERILLTGGGIIPAEDIDALKKMGTGDLFTPGTPIEDCVKYVREEIKRRRVREGA
ncbi:MAG: cobalamin B12-binding domain-containing protein [Planctomycetota bacterium]